MSSEPSEPSSMPDPIGSGSGAGAGAGAGAGSSVGSGLGAGVSEPSSAGSGGRRRGRRQLKRHRDLEPSSEGGLGTSDRDSSGDELVNVDHGKLLKEYEARPALDVYDKEMLDEREQEDDPEDARYAAEKDLDDRDRRQRARGGRRDAAIFEDESEDRERYRSSRRRRMEAAATGDDEMQREAFDLEMHRGGPLHDWLAQDEAQHEIKTRFRNFLHTYTDSLGNNVYHQAIIEMCRDNRQSLVIDHTHMLSALPTVSEYINEHPDIMLGLMNEVAKEVVESKYPDYGHIHSEIYVRIANFALQDVIRDLRHFHIGTLVRVDGVVTRRTGVMPQLKMKTFNCACGQILGPFTERDGRKPVTPGACPACAATTGFTLNTEKTLYRNYQRVTLQESPSKVPAGRVPRSKDVIVVADLVDSCRPGEEVEITGTYTNLFDASLNTRQGFPVFGTIIEANYITKQSDAFAAYTITAEDKTAIEGLSKDPNIARRIIKSLAPSIYGHDFTKRALALSLFGGQERKTEKSRVRGDINVLMLGDPGVAKSQFLKYVEKTAPRAVFTTGKGASAVGLTAAVHRDPATGEWTLEGGALVLADRGTCLIDEFDKMNDADRTSIHEAMEQQSISISKAGIVTTLRARCGVIAAANPIGGRYDASKTFTENVTLTDPIVQRFDILCVLQDKVDSLDDARLAKFVVSSHVRSHPDVDPAIAAADPTRELDKDIIPTDLLKKYLVYARRIPEISMKGINREKIENVYKELRQQSNDGQGIPIAVRHLESLLRMSAAHARMHLRKHITDRDVDVAISVLVESFVMSQKYAVQRSVKSKFSQYINATKDRDDLLLLEVKNMIQSKKQHYLWAKQELPEAVEISLAELRAQAARLNLAEELSSFLSSSTFTKAGLTFDKTRNAVVVGLPKRIGDA